MAGAIARVSLNTPRPRPPGNRAARRTTLYGCPRTRRPPPAPCGAAATPHVHDVVAREPDEPIRHLARRLRGLRPTHGLDLHGSVRSAALRLLVRCHWTGYRKRKLARALLIATKLDVYGARVPVAERYFEAARALDTRPDGGPPEFCLSQGARDRVAEWLAQRALAHAPLIALAPGAAHATKRWPLPHWIALADRLRAAGYRPVVVGGSEDRGLAQQLAEGQGERGGRGGRVESAAGGGSLQGDRAVGAPPPGAASRGNRGGRTGAGGGAARRPPFGPPA